MSDSKKQTKAEEAMPLPTPIPFRSDESIIESLIPHVEFTKKRRPQKKSPRR